MQGCIDLSKPVRIDQRHVSAEQLTSKIRLVSTTNLASGALNAGGLS